MSLPGSLSDALSGWKAVDMRVVVVVVVQVCQTGETTGSTLRPATAPIKYIVHIVPAKDVPRPMEVDEIGIQPTYTGICDVTGMVLYRCPNLVALNTMVLPFDFHTVHAVAE